MREVGVWRVFDGDIMTVWRVLKSDVKDTFAYRLSKESVRTFCTSTFERVTLSLDQYFLDPTHPTEKELLLLSLLKPSIHKQVVEIMKITIDNSKEGC